MYLLRKLKSFSVSSIILSRFYQSFIESLLCFSFVCWFNSLSIHDKNSLHSIVNICSKIIGDRQRDLSTFCDQQTLRRAVSIISMPHHALAEEFVLMQSGRRFKMPQCKTNWYLKSFVPHAIQLMNKSKNN